MNAAQILVEIPLAFLNTEPMTGARATAWTLSDIGLKEHVQVYSHWLKAVDGSHLCILNMAVLFG